MRSDPFGARPLHYAATPGGLRSGASALWLLREAGIPARLDAASVAAAVCHALPPERSLWLGVHRVPPGHALVADGAAPRIERYWEPPPPAVEADGDDDARAAELLERLRRAIRSRIDAGRVALSLSGGLDSAALLALLAEAACGVRAYSIDGDFTDEGESAQARELARRFGAEHVVVSVDEIDLAAHFADAVLACENLLWNGRAAASLLLFREVRTRGDGVLLTGTGADEVLCGNPTGLAGFAARREAEARLTRSLLTDDAATSLPRPEPPARPEGLEPLAWQQRLFLASVLPESTLPPECRAAAAAGIDVRLPYLDPELADLALRLPIRALAAGATGKLLLRRALRGRLPDALLASRKMPRLAPAGGRSAEAREAWHALFARWLAPEWLEALAVVEPARVAALIQEHRGLDPGSERRGIADAVLLRLVSASVLNAAAESQAAERPEAMPDDPTRAKASRVLD